MVDSGQFTEVLKLYSVWNSYKLSCYVWEAGRSPRALVFISHGVTEHMGRYNSLAQFLTDSGILVFGHDHVGHGQSEGDRVHVEDIDTYVQDIIHHVELMKNNYPHLPCIIMGHSMGGLIATHASIQRPGLFTGLILSAAAIKPVDMGIVATSILSFGVKSLAFLMPKVPLFPWKTTNITSLPEEVKRYEEDSLTHCGLMKPAWTSAMIDSMRLAAELLHKISLPTLVMHGVQDPIVGYRSSEFVYRTISSEDKTFMQFEGFHDILHDVDQERAEHFIRDWITEHIL